jgi:predicted dithiol-disulfide oxidoreductase (DUF899 family)
VTVSNLPLAQIEKYRARTGWTLPFVSSRGTTFARNSGAGEGWEDSPAGSSRTPAYAWWNRHDEYGDAEPS